MENQVHFEILQVATTQKLQRFTVNQCVVICGYSAVLRKKIFPKYFFQHNIMKQTDPLSVENRLLFHYTFAEF